MTLACTRQNPLNSLKPAFAKSGLSPGNFPVEADVTQKSSFLNYHWISVVKSSLSLSLSTQPDKHFQLTSVIYDHSAYIHACTRRAHVGFQYYHIARTTQARHQCFYFT